MSGNVRKLKPRQVHALEHLVTGSTIQETSERCNVSERQVHRWLGEPGFKRELNALQLNALEGVSRRLVQLAGDAVNALEDVLQNPGRAGAGVKLRACAVILESVFKFREMLDFETRLNALEGKVGNDK